MKAHLVRSSSETAPGRARAAYDSEEVFLEAVRLGRADRYTFRDLEEAAAFGRAKLDSLKKTAEEIEKKLKAPVKEPEVKKHRPARVELKQRRRRA